MPRAAVNPTPERLFHMTITRHKQKGVMLLEALIGLLIFSIGVLALIAMQSVAISQVRDAQFRTDASLLSERIMGELMVFRNLGNASTAVTTWQTDVASTLPSGNGSVTESTSSFGAAIKEIRISITWRAPGASTDSNHVTVGLLSY